MSFQFAQVSTYIDIFDKKSLMWGWWAKKSFLFNDVKLLKNQFVEKCLIGGVLANFYKKVPFWGPNIVMHP